MALPTRLEEYLARTGVKHQLFRHEKGYTARAAARDLGIAPELLAKTIVVSVGGRPFLVAVPASCRLDLAALGKLVGGEVPVLVPESSFRQLFPDCQIGTMPLLGGAYGMDVVVDEGLAGGESITFQAGSHREVVRMAWEDFARLERPRTGPIAKRVDL